MVINEVLVNSAGTTDREAFVELSGPPDLPLSGFSLTGINGNGGSPYVLINLQGAIPASGYFVVAHPQASAATIAMAQQFDSNVDFQNGPDSILLSYQGTAIDAVGYGSFGASDVFAGEGMPAAAPPQDQTLGRDAWQLDTDDNASDFTVRDPTPGRPNGPRGAPPNAALSCPMSVRVGELFLLDASASTDPDDAIISYTFDAGDGSPPTTPGAASMQYQYTASGTRTATVSVHDEGGNVSVASCTILVTNQAPMVQLDCPASVNVGVAATFDASASTDPNGSALTWRFEFGDGASAPGTAGVAMHSFLAGGVYTVVVTVSDPEAASGTASCNVVVVDQPPTAVLQCPATAARGQTVSFSAAGSSDDTGITAYAFDFGDGSAPVSGSSASVSHLYTVAGTYLVSLAVTDGLDQAGTDSCMLDVEEPCGNGVLEQGEECDDGNPNSADGCSASCTLECMGPPGSSSSPRQMGTYTRACATASWGELYGYTEHWYTFTRNAPFSLRVDVHGGGSNQCPTSYEPQPCGSGLMNARSTLYLGTTSIQAGGGYSCGELGQMNNLASGTYVLKVRVDSNGYGYDCAGSASYQADLLFGPPN